ncbi:MAG TPA: FAD-dependent oxidoreductase [Casimicrobiaceae bacterium]|nr:FAD-dependent oxidoreductase [Casimicrobiaceae bacterium]
MPRSRLVTVLARAVADARAAHAVDEPPKAGRRDFLRRAGALGGAAAIAGTWQPAWAAAAGGSQARVAVVGGGLAGLCALDALARAGVQATLFEAAPRVGGRCLSERSAFGSQVAERGGEFIDTGHAQIRLLAADLGLALDDVLEAETPGTVPLWWLDGAAYTLDDATADLTPLLPALEADVAVLTGTLPTYDQATAGQRALDRLSAAAWIDTRVPGGARSRLGRLLANAYTEELGADPARISSISVIALLDGTPRDRLSPYEESDQRYHVRGGNDRIVTALAERVQSHVETGSRLVAITRDGRGRHRLHLARDGAARTHTCERVILALPFSLLRDVDLAHAGFRTRKLAAIRHLGMGHNTKLQLQFASRHWRTHGGNGETRLEGPYVTSWEVTRAQEGDTGIVNFFSGGSVAQRAGEGTPEAQARAVLAAIEPLYPGIGAQWTGQVIRNAWDRYPWTRGSYSLLEPGHYTSFHGIEWAPEGHVHFAGEHTSAEASGYMEGAVETGQRAAREVLESLGLRAAARAA